VGLIFAVLVAAVVWWRLRPRKFKTDKFQKRWKDLQKLCAHPETWPQAIIQADKLLNEVLKKGHYKGGSMGERLVAAHNQFSDSDGVWFGHKLSNKLIQNSELKLKERDVKEALIGIGQGLKDLGALKR
jgi:hypothetical protein